MRLRYSFKVLMIVFTLLAVCVGIFAVRLHGARRQRDAVAALQAAEVSVAYKYETRDGGPVMNFADPLEKNSPSGYSNVSRWKVWLGRQFGRDLVFDVGYVYKGTPLTADLVARLPYLRGLEHVHLNVGKGFNDEAWQALLRCRQIQRLTLQRDHLDSERRLTGLAKLGQLTELRIQHGELTVEDAREIARLDGLRKLTLSLVGTTDDALQPLVQLKNLEYFELTHRGHSEHVTNTGVAFVAQMSNLRSLTLARLPLLNDGVVSHMERLTRLDSLNLDQASIAGTELQRLSSLPNLKSLNLIGKPVDDEAMKKLAKLKQLETLNISWTKVTDAGLKHAGSLKNLRNLSISGDGITDGGIVEISRLTQLEELMIGNTNVTDDGLKHVAKLPKLRALSLNENAKITKAGVAALKAVLPECSVY